MTSTAAGPVVRVEPRGAALDMFRSKEPVLLVSGAAGTGKSVACLYKVHLAAMANDGFRGLLLRKTLTSLTQSTLVTFRKLVAKEALASSDVVWFGGSGDKPPEFRYHHTGSTITIGGLDRPTRLLSTEYDMAFVDEATEVTAEDVETISGRLRNGAISYQQLIMATNPGAPTHHLYQAAMDGRSRILYSRHEDNPRMYQDGQWTDYGAQYLARLDALTGLRKQRMRYGRWVAAEGMCYSAWNPAVNLIDRFPVPREWRRIVSVDFGYNHPMVIQWWAIDPDGRMYMYRELFQTGKLVSDHAKSIKTLIARHAPTGNPDGEPWPDAFVCDHDAEGRATLAKELGITPRRANKRVKLGIDTVNELLRPSGDGRPRMFIMRDSTVWPDQTLKERNKPASTAEEIDGYVWKKNAEGQDTDEPVKELDDGCDTLRYAAMFAHPPTSRRGKVQLPSR